MNLKKRFFSCLLILVLAFSLLPLSASAAKDFTQTLADSKQGIIQLYGRGQDDTHATAWTGSGFAIGKAGQDSNIFLTNWHCITASGEFALDQVEIWILQEGCSFDSYGYPDSSHSIKCEVLRTTSGYPDYAVIRATSKVTGYKALPLLSSKDVPDGTTVYALGYPGEVSDISTTQYGIDDITATNGIISQHMQLSAADDTWVLLHTAQIAHGNSGGPLITEDGAVVGLNTYSRTDDSTRYMAVYIDYAMDGLESLDIAYDVYGESTGFFDGILAGSGSGSIIAIVCACIVLIAVVVTIVVIMSKKQKEEQARQAAAMALARQQDEDRRRQEAEAQRRQQEAEAQRRRQETEARQKDAQQQRAHLRCWDGRIVPVGAGATIGRDPSCTIVLPENAPGVSRTHCRLEMQGSQLILIDVGSSYGTLIHGKRIPANTPVALKVGSSFCLASEKYSFTVC